MYVFLGGAEAGTRVGAPKTVGVKVRVSLPLVKASATSSLQD